MRLRPRTVAGWVGWASFVLILVSWPVLSAGVTLGFRLVDLPAILVLAGAGAGFEYVLFKSFGWGRREISRPAASQHWSGLKGEWASAADRIVAGAESDAQEARRVRAQPWYADAVVDLNEVYPRWLNAGHFGGLWDTVLVVPNPYFVLPLVALVKWGFATAVEVREATQWATSNTPPVRWQNPFFRERLNFMGWSDAEAYARVGLHFWRTDPQTPNPSAATMEARIRSSGQIYDVPRPASLV